MTDDYVSFTKEMKKDYTILAPNMLPMHFKLILQVLKDYGYHTELLETNGPQIAETGLRYVHNDTCYPAILVIGQFITALQSGKYDPHKTALILFQTGGGCRASNYIPLLRKALQKAGYGYVPVISFNFKGLEKHPGFRLTLPILHRMLYAIYYADLLMLLVNQTRPYELTKGQSQKLADDYTEKLARQMKVNGISFKKVREECKKIIADFAAIPVHRTQKVKVGVVGEIYVKFSPLGNNNLEDFLISEGAEIVVPGLLGFFVYCIYNNLVDHRLYGTKKKIYPFAKIAYDFMVHKEDELIELVKQEGTFTPPSSFANTIPLVKGYIHHGTKMGEGWLLPAEMLELSENGVKNIVCTQPFGCLPNHICGKGMIKPIKEKNPDVNIVAIDYDAGAAHVNQENRLKLMLANAKKQNQTDESPKPQKQ